MHLNAGKALWNSTLRRLGLRQAPLRAKTTGPAEPKQPKEPPLRSWYFPHYRLTFRACTKGEARARLRSHLAEVAGKRLADVKLPTGLVCLLTKE